MQREVLQPALQPHTHERLGGLATQGPLKVEELVVEVPPAGEEAHEDAEPLVSVDQRHDAERLQPLFLQSCRKQRILRFDLVGVDDDEDGGVAQWSIGGTRPTSGFTPATSLNSPASSRRARRTRSR